MARNRRRNTNRKRGNAGMQGVKRAVSRLQSGIASAKQRVPKDPPPSSIGIRRSGIIKFNLYVGKNTSRVVNSGGLNQPGYGKMPNNQTTLEITYSEIFLAALAQLIGVKPTAIPAGVSFSIKSVTVWGGETSPTVELDIQPSLKGFYPGHVAFDSAAKNHRPAVKWTSPVPVWHTSVDTAIFLKVDVGSLSGGSDSLNESENVSTLHISVDIVSADLEKLV